MKGDIYVQGKRGFSGGSLGWRLEGGFCGRSNNEFYERQ